MDQETTVLDSTAALGKFVPEFSAAMTGNKPFNLSDHKGRKVILYFYPKDNTPGCTTEAMQFRDAYEGYQRSGVSLFGVSRDSIRSHDVFKEKLALPFELISDPEETLCAMFNVIKMKTMYGKQSRGVERSTFVIDAAGKLVKEWRGVKVPGHVDDVLEFVKALD
jgi:peroxiredoxin Q/BCP